MQQIIEDLLKIYIEVKYPAPIIEGGKLFDEIEVVVEKQESLLYRVVGPIFPDTSTFANHILFKISIIFI